MDKLIGFGDGWLYRFLERKWAFNWSGSGRIAIEVAMTDFSVSVGMDQLSTEPPAARLFAVFSAPGQHQNGHFDNWRLVGHDGGVRRGKSFTGQAQNNLIFLTGGNHHDTYN